MRQVPPHVIAWKNKISRALEARGHETAARNLDKCAETELLLICMNCAARKYVVYHCQSRICPVCSWSISRDRAHYADALLRQMKYPKFLTLTMPTWTGDPREGIKYLRQCFTKLREQKVWKPVVGGVYQIELKPKEEGWHIHVHILMDAPYLPKQKIFTAWKDILGTDYASIDIRACKTKEQRDYVTKYVAKAADFKGDAEAVVDWYEATKGSRLFATFGKWYNAKIEELLDPEEFKPFKPACENCGQTGHMFFARDGPWIFGRDRWNEEQGSWCGDDPVERPLSKSVSQETLDFLDIL